MARRKARLGRRGWVAAAALSLAAVPVIVTVAAANPGVVGGFEVDANLQSATAQDWTAGSGGTGVLASDGTSTLGAVLVTDDVKSDGTTFPGGAKESDPAGWLPIQGGQVTPKTDITNVYAFGKVDTDPYIFNAMERLPKAGDVHLDFEYNKDVGTNGIPNRQENDILVAYDLGGSRNSNEGAITVRIYKAKANGTYDYANPDASATGSDAATGSGVEALLNTSSVPSGPWGTYDANGSFTNGDIPAFSFAEAGINLRTAVGVGSACYNWVTVKSRSSESVTSQLKDTTGPKNFPFCGGLKVKKFIDYNADGARSTGLSATTYGNGTDPVDEPYAAGWAYSVTNSSNVVKCSGSTAVPTGGTVALLDCTGLTPGTYTVTETQKSHYTGTSPANNVLTQTVTVGLASTQTVTFGNACYVAKTFRVTGVPSGVTPFAWYKPVTVTGGVYSQGTRVKVTLAQDGTTPSTYEGVLSDTFLDSSMIAWGYGVTVGGTDQFVTVKAGTSAGTTELFAGAGVPDSAGLCAKTNSTAYTASVVTGSKFKDLDFDGVKDAADSDPATPDEVGLADFKFDLKDGTGTVIASAYSCGSIAHACGVSDPVGTYKFTGVNAGSYTVVEDLTSGPAGWEKIGAKVSGSLTQTLTATVPLGQNLTLADYGNTPLSRIHVELESLTNPDVTKIGSLSCSPTGGTALSLTTETTDYKYRTGDLRLGSYTCVLVVTDP